MLTDDEILAKFPYEQQRPDQLDAIRTILDNFNSNKNIVIVEMPTGAGKSAIAYAVAQFFESAFWICPQKILQDQIMRDFATPSKNLTPIIDLKGRNNYECTHNQRTAQILYRSLLTDQGKSPNEIDQAVDKLMSNKKADDAPEGVLRLLTKETQCNAGICRTRDGKSKCKECLPDKCSYWKRHTEAMNARICLMNFKSFLFQTAITKRFKPREFMIIDEAHSIESELMSFVNLTLSDRSFKKHGVSFSHLATVQEYRKFMEDNGVEDIIDSIIKIASNAGDVIKEDEWLETKRKFKNFMDTAESGNWVSIFKPNDKWNTIELKPVYVRDMAKDLVFSKADKILMMSATILSPQVVCSSLGIEGNSFSIRYGSKFPVENRPIYFTPVGSMSYKNKHATMPKVIKKVDEILNKYHDKKGIIHTHNFEIAKALLKKCKNNSRMLFQEDWPNKAEMLIEHGKSKNSVIVAPAMHEGLDLKDDLSRFQIIVKIPYPPIKDNPQLEARMKDSQEYYDWITTLKLVQSSGRSVRSETDWAHTYIIDSDFEWFRKKVDRMLPAWFKQALVD